MTSRVSPYNLPDVVATIGVFDGVHRGHQALLRHVVERAAQVGAMGVCVTFSPHPEDVLRPDTEITHLCAVQDRIALIKQFGIAEVLLLEFTPSIARMSPEEFMDLLLRRFRLRELWIGSDFALGRDRSGGPERLGMIGREHGFSVGSFPPVEYAGSVVSSSRIRRLLAGGHVEDAAELLERPYRVRGRVVAGDHRGAGLGFPTANVAVVERLALPANGVYATWCRIGESGPRISVTNVGVRPTFSGERRLVEVHLIDFVGDLYGEDLAVDFVACIRDERRFPSASALMERIRQDVDAARTMLAAGDATTPGVSSV